MGKGFFDSKPNIETGIIDSFKKQLHNGSHRTLCALHSTNIKTVKSGVSANIAEFFKFLKILRSDEEAKVTERS